MKLTTKGRFAVTAMLDIALHQDSDPVSLSAVSERQSISLFYLEQLFGKLRRHGLVESIRGSTGGYVLARLAQQISIADIIYAVDEALDATYCGGKQNCEKGTNGLGGQCMTHELWETLNHKMIDYLASISLANLVEKEHMRRRQNEKNLALPCTLIRNKSVPSVSSTIALSNSLKSI